MTSKHVTLQEAPAILGRQLRDYRKRVLRISVTEMGELYKQYGIEGGISPSTVRRMEKGDPAVSLRTWLAAWQITGMLGSVIESAEPDAQILSTLMSEAMEDVVP